MKLEWEANKMLACASLSPATLTTYRRAIDLYANFVRLTYDSQYLFPTPQNTLVAFIMHLQKLKFSATSITTYISALSFVNKINGHSDNCSSFIVRKLLTAISRSSKRPDSRLPLTEPMLKKLIDALHHVINDNYHRRLFKAMFLTLFHGFLRIGEITVHSNNCTENTVVQLQDCRFNNDIAFTLSLSNFKHNTSKKEFHITIDVSDTMYCPVRAMHEYICLRGNQPGPLFKDRESKAISRNLFEINFKAYLAFVGLPSKFYTTHSFRIGAATFASQNNIPDDKIQKMGRWKTNAFKHYIRINNFSRK